MGKKKTQQKQEKNTPAPAETKNDKKQKKAAPKQQKAVDKKSETKSPAKTKPIKKEQKPSRQQAPAPVADKKSKTQKKEQTNVQIFTPEFYTKLNTFQTYYKEVLELKSSSNNSNLSDELTTVNTRVRELLEDASSKILKNELVTLEDWIQSEQKRLRSQIATVEGCLEQSQKSLESTKAFSVDEISNQLKLIKKRISEKQSQLDHYGVLLTRSRNIYQESQSEKVQVKAAQEENNNDNVGDEELELDDLQ